MMNLKLHTEDPLPGHAATKIIAGNHPEFSAPKPTIAPAGSAAVPAAPGTPLFMRLPANSCDVRGCKKFGYAFPSAQALLEHKRAVHLRHQAQTSPAAPATISAVGADATATAKKYQCSQCAQSFDKPWEISKHTRWKHPQPKLEKLPPKETIACPLCSKPYPRSALGMHFGKSHEGQILKLDSDPYECTACGTTFAALGAARGHADSKHGARVDNTGARLLVRREPRKPITPPIGPDANFKGGELRNPAPGPRGETGPEASLIAHRHPHPEDPKFFIQFTGNKADCGNAALLLIQNGFANLTTGEI